MNSEDFTYYFFLGSHPALSLAELVSVLTSYQIRHEISEVHRTYVAVSAPDELPPDLLRTLGGCDRFALRVGSVSSDLSPDDILDLVSPLPSKWRLGVSILDTSQNIKDIALRIKKAARTRSSKVAFIAPASSAQRLNAAQVLFNALCDSPHAELTFIPTDNGYDVVRTVAVQDISSYELRDTKRPALDPKVGTMPPKLAQMMLHIGVSAGVETEPAAVLDPFCGMGTILQEGWLMGFKMLGTDASPQMIESASINLRWLYEHFELADDIEPELQLHDIQQSFPTEWHASFDAIVTEPFLGKPLSSPLSPDAYDGYVNDLRQLYVHAFKHIKPVLKPGGRVLFAFPAPLVGSRTASSSFQPILPYFIDEIAKLGYRIEHILPPEAVGMYADEDSRTYVYKRPDAFVGRELTLWTSI